MNTIYHLIASIEGVNPFVFYVGRTIDPERRFKEHSSASVEGAEDKYKFIREWTAVGGTWELATTTADCEFTECLRVARLNKGTDAEQILTALFDETRWLTNMRDGDLLDAIADPTIVSLRDLRVKQQERKKQSIKQRIQVARKMGGWTAAHDIQVKKQLIDAIMNLDDGVTSLFAMNHMRQLKLTPNTQNQLFFLSETATVSMSSLNDWRLRELGDQIAFAVDCGWILADCPLVVELMDELQRRNET